jgi:uncharacterized protein (DUF427 family)
MTILRVSPGVALCRMPPEVIELICSTAMIAVCWRGMLVADAMPVVCNSEAISTA